LNRKNCVKYPAQLGLLSLGKVLGRSAVHKVRVEVLDDVHKLRALTWADFDQEKKAAPLGAKSFDFVNGRSEMVDTARRSNVANAHRRSLKILIC
jgi:hypothetical protein